MSLNDASEPIEEKIIVVSSDPSTTARRAVDGRLFVKIWTLLAEVDSV